MNAQQTNVEVIANNIANINTTAFKRSRAEFVDLLYQVERAAGTPNRGGQEAVPEGAQIGLGVRTTAIRNLHMQGALTNTGNKLDLALNGRGWFQVAGANNEQFFTRAGSFNKNATGQVYVRTGADNNLQLLGQLTLSNFTNEAGLEALGSNLYRETTASGTPVPGVPGDPGFGSVHQGYLEHSNVDA